MVTRPQRRVPTNVLSRPQPVQRDVSTPQMQPNVMQPKPVQTIAPRPQIKAPTEVRNFGLGSAEGGPVQAPTQVNTPTPRTPSLATRENPMISVSTQPQQIDIEGADMGTLLREQDAIQYKIASGSFTQDDFVRGREIARKLAEQMNPTPTMEANPLLTQLEQQAEQLSTRDRNPEVTAKRSMLQSQFDTRRAQLEENARRARESTIGNIAMAGGGRSSVAQQAELDIQRELQNQINAEQQAMELELRAYEAQLQGADSEQLQSIYNQINELKGQAAQSQMILNQKAEEQKMASVNSFNQTLQQLATSSGIELDANDEKALEQVINIARNTDGSVNEEVVAGLPKQFQALVRAGVMNGVGKTSMPAPKVERIGGTTKNPVYGYWDGSKFVTTNAMGVPTGGTVRAGGGGGGGVTRPSGVAPSLSESYDPRMISVYTSFMEGTGKPTEKQIASLGGYERFVSDAYNAYIQNETQKLKSGGFSLNEPTFYATLTKDQRKILQTDMRTLRGVTQKIDALAKDINEKGLPQFGQTLVGRGRELKQKVKDLQLILKEQGIYNLGVLNGPDLAIIEGALPNIDPARWAEGPEQYISYLNNMRNIFVNSVNANVASQGLSFNNGGSVNYTGNKETTQTSTTAPQGPTAPITGTSGISQFKPRVLK